MVKSKPALVKEYLADIQKHVDHSQPYRPPGFTTFSAKARVPWI